MTRRVAVIGNMNNAGFSLTRYLRDRGIEAHLLLFDQEQDHFMPASDTFDLAYMNYTRTVSWGTQSRYLKVSKAEVRRDLEGYDALIGCGMAPGILWKAGIPLDIFVPYGWDIWEYPRFRLRNPAWIAKTWPAVVAQRKGIAQTAVFHMTPTNHFYESQWRRLAGRSERWIEGSPIVYAPAYASERLGEIIDKTHWGHEFKAIRDETDLMVVSHARHVWTCGEASLDDKGTRKLLEGWARFRRSRPEVRARLVTMEYGSDVQASKRLISELGISDSVIWMPKMARKDVMVGLLLADLVCGEFGQSWMAAGTFYEALAAAKPLMSYRDDALYRKDFPDLYPIMNASTAVEIEEQLANYLADPERYVAMGKAGLAWYQRAIADAAVDKYVAYIGGKRGQAGAMPKPGEERTIPVSL